MSVIGYELIAVGIYLAIVGVIGYCSYLHHLSATDFILGDRSLNYWLTALSAHASDMSNWLFMGYPALIFLNGLQGAWAGIGLIIFMYLNWQIVAPKIRIATEQYNSLTFSSFFESRVADTSGVIRAFTSIMCIFFYIIYIAAGLTGMAYLIESLFGLPYFYGLIIGACIVIPYVFFGGYRTLAWIDLFQGMFLMIVIIFVPLYITGQIGGWAMLSERISASNLSLSLFPNLTGMGILTIFLSICGWGLGYFGQPHIVTKFMGIKNVKDMAKSKYVGMTWMTLALTAATLVGLVAIAYFYITGIQNPEHVFIVMVNQTFHPILIGFFLCAVVAATINTVGSQILVLTSSLTEDLYKRLFRKKASQRELLLVSRAGVIFSSLIAFFIALPKSNTIYGLVLYAWSGLGSSFGPLLLFSLYSKNVNKYGSWAGILIGGVLAAVWPLINGLFTYQIPAVVVGFIGGSLGIYIVSLLTNKSFGTRKAT
jgi:sodium/proline symporter